MPSQVSSTNGSSVRAIALPVPSSCDLIEAAVVGLSLSMIAIVSGNKLTDWLGSAAVFITFLHGQLSFAMQESQGRMTQPSVENYHWSGRLFVTKEILWIATFALAGCWPLCAGSVLFATYPRWRALLRRS